MTDILTKLKLAAKYIDYIKERCGNLTIMEEGAQKLFREAAAHIENAPVWEASHNSKLYGWSDWGPTNVNFVDGKLKGWYPDYKVRLRPDPAAKPVAPPTEPGKIPDGYDVIPGSVPPVFTKVDK